MNMHTPAAITIDGLWSADSYNDPTYNTTVQFPATAEVLVWHPSAVFHGSIARAHTVSLVSVAEVCVLEQ